MSRGSNCSPPSSLLFLPTASPKLVFKEPISPRLSNVSFPSAAACLWLDTSSKSVRAQTSSVSAHLQISGSGDEAGSAVDGGLEGGGVPGSVNHTIMD